LALVCVCLKFLIIQVETKLILSNKEMMNWYADLDESKTEREVFMTKSNYYENSIN
jgi:phosphoenolpyruvate carboxylase